MNRREFMAGIVAVTVAPAVPALAPYTWPVAFKCTASRVITLNGAQTGQTITLLVNGQPRRIFRDGDQLTVRLES